MIVLVNGEETELEAGAVIGDAARALGIDPFARGIALALDGEVVPRSELAARPLSEGQRVEVVTAMQGGC